MRNQIALEELYPEESFHVMDGLDSAIIGMDEASGRVIYSVKKIIDVFMHRDGMLYDEAVEFFEFNTRRANQYNGEIVIICDDLNLDNLN